MSRRLLLSTLRLVLVTAAASCAAPSAAPRAEPETSSPAATTDAAVSTCEPEPRPRAACCATRATRAAPPADSGETVSVLPKDGGWRIDELLDMVAKEAGVSIRYDGDDTAFKQTKLQICGAHVIRRSDLFDWLQAVLSYRKLVIVPVGPKTADGKPRWLVIEQADRNLKVHPPVIDESDVVKYAERDGLYIVTMLRVRDTVDPTRVRDALSSLSTRTAGIGRIVQDAGGRDLIVGDFAPVVASMKRMLDRINAETPPSAVRPPAAPVAPTAAKPEK